MQVEKTRRVKSKSKASIKDWTVLYCRTTREVEDAIRDKRFIHSHIIRAVKRMLKKRVTTDMCLEIYCIADSTSFWISVKLDDYEEVLDLILRHLEEREEYEECAEIVKLMEGCKVLKKELEEE
jgi:hypothetical protein